MFEMEFLLEEIEFLNCFSVTNRIIYLRQQSTILLQSWIVFQTFCLNIDANRIRVQNHDYELFNGPAYNITVVNFRG
jgi:hypothetical protein